MRWSERIGRRLKLRDMHILLAVAKSGSMGKAATSLAMSQPAVSKAIADLEHTLGVRLLDRSQHGIEPTIYGTALLKWGTAVFADLRQAVLELEFLAEPTAGELAVGCTEPYAAGLVAAIIDRLSPQFPKAAFHVVTADIEALALREFPERKIEVALMPIAHLSPQADLDAEFLFDDRHVILAAPNSPWFRRRQLALNELVDAPWVLPPPDSPVGLYIASAFRSAGLEPPRAHTVTFSIPLHYSLVATGRFLTTLPLSMLHYRGHAGLKALPIKFSAAPRPMGIVTLKGRTLNPLAHHFIACARKVAQSLPRSN
jgi:DNA-binding transcriptional LysR family regulator